MTAGMAYCPDTYGGSFSILSLDNFKFAIGVWVLQLVLRIIPNRYLTVLKMPQRFKTHPDNIRKDTWRM